MDPLEEFIRNNKEAFDDKEAPKNTWQNIERAMDFRHQSLWNSVVMWRAAAVIFMMATAALLFVKQNNPMVETNGRGALSASDFNDVEKFYVTQISEKVQMIDKFQKNEGLNGFTQDFQQLEAMYMVLKEQLKSNPSEEVKDALVLNLLVRIDLLNQRLQKLDKQYHGKNGDKEEDDRSV